MHSNASTLIQDKTLKIAVLFQFCLCQHFFVTLQRTEINLQIKKSNTHEENITTRMPLNVTGAGGLIIHQQAKM